MLERILKLVPGLNNLIILANAIEEAKVDKDGSIYIRYKKHVIMETNGHMLVNTKNSNLVLQSEYTFINPLDRISVSSDIEKCISDSNNKTDKIIKENNLIEA